MKNTPRVAGLTCPDDPSHGPLLEVDGRPYCPHQSHDGRPKTHALGVAPRTNPFPKKVLHER